MPSWRLFYFCLRYLCCTSFTLCILCLCFEANNVKSVKTWLTTALSVYQDTWIKTIWEVWEILLYLCKLHQSILFILTRDHRLYRSFLPLVARFGVFFFTLRHVGDAGPIIKLPCKQTHEILYQSDNVLYVSLYVTLPLSLFLGHIVVAEVWCKNITMPILALKHAAVCITQQTLKPEGNKK